MLRTRAPDTPSSPCGGAAPSEAGHTSHISAIDREGNAVAVTFSIGLFGSAVVAPGTGFLLNSNIDTFPLEGSPGETIGGRRMSQAGVADSIVVKGGRPILVVGGAGGSAIPMGVVLAISNMVDFGLSVDMALDAPRLHEKICCIMNLEDGRIRDYMIDTLVGRGHSVKRMGEYSFLSPHLHAIGYDRVTGARLGASDSRDTFGVMVQSRP